MTDYDNSEESKFIIYLDANNLYGYVISQYLPYGGFKWLSQEKIKNFDVNSISEDSPDGYILEVDLEYPDELHDFHNDYPLAPEKLEVSNDMLSKYCSDIAKKYKMKVDGANKLQSRTKYLEQNGVNPVKRDRKRKVWYLFLLVF